MSVQKLLRNVLLIDEATGTRVLLTKSFLLEKRNINYQITLNQSSAAFQWLNSIVQDVQEVRNNYLFSDAI